MRLVLFISALLLLSTAPARAQGKLKVFVLAGQSNMEGAGQIRINPKNKNGGKGSLELSIGPTKRSIHNASFPHGPGV